jgi:hypothetical protein
LALAQKLFHFSPLRGGKGAAETRAFQRRRGRSEPQRLPQFLLFGNRKRERAMENVAGAQCVHGVHRESRRLLQIALLVEPDRALRPARPRQERRRQFGDLLQGLAIVGDAGGLL